MPSEADAAPVDAGKAGAAQGDMATAQPPSSAARAKAELFRRGRLRELVEADPGSSGAALRTACKRAEARHHPDKGGDPEVFKLVREAVDILRCTECLRECALRETHIELDGVAGLRETHIREVEELREVYDRLEEALVNADAALPRCQTAPELARANARIFEAERNLSRIALRLRGCLDSCRARAASQKQAREEEMARREEAQRAREEEQRAAGEAAKEQRRKEGHKGAESFAHETRQGHRVSIPDAPSVCRRSRA